MIEGKIWLYGCLTMIFLRKREKQAALKNQRTKNISLSIIHYTHFGSILVDIHVLFF